MTTKSRRSGRVMYASGGTDQPKTARHRDDRVCEGLEPEYAKKMIGIDSRR